MTKPTPIRRTFDRTEDALLAQLRHFLDESNVAYAATPASLVARLRSPEHHLDTLLILLDPSVDQNAGLFLDTIEGALRRWITDELHARTESYVKVDSRA